MVACGTCRHVACGPPSHFVVPLLQIPYAGTPDMAADLNWCAPLAPLGHEDDCAVRSIIPSVWLAFVNPEMISFGEHTALGISGTLVANDTVIELMQPECGVLCQNCMLACRVDWDTARGKQARNGHLANEHELELEIADDERRGLLGAGVLGIVMLVNGRRRFAV